MDPFLRQMSILMVLLALAGCHQRRADVPPGRIYPVTLEQGLLPSSSVPGRAGRAASSGGSWALSSNLTSGSGKDALVGFVVVVSVLIVAAVVVSIVDAVTAAPEPVLVKYHLTLSGPEVPQEEVIISDADSVCLDDRQHAALVRGSYTRAVIRPAAWEGTSAAPTQEVRLTLAPGRIRLAPVVEPGEPSRQVR
jgi:hypothetical protein